jgi:hypothetical protein
MPKNHSTEQDEAPALCTVEDEARALRTLACLWTALDELQKQRGLMAWREVGSLDAQDLLHALETGGTHPLLRKWEELKAGPARNRPPPGASEQAARRLIVLLRVALQRTGLSKTAARKHIASALQKYGRQIGLPPLPLKADEALRHWERDLKPPLGLQDEAVIAHALDRCGKNRAQLTKHFLGLVEFARKPLPAGARWR